MRLVSLLPAATEIVDCLGLFDQLVGVSHACDFPAKARARPVVTQSLLAEALPPAAIDAAVAAAQLDGRPLYTINAARLAELEPDLILTQGICDVCAVTAETLAANLTFTPLGSLCDVPTLSLSGHDFAGICADILAVGRACGVPERSEALVASLQERWRALPKRTGPRPRVLMLEWPDPPWTAGHWVPEQVAAAGGTALLGAPGEPSRRTDWPTIVDADPDILISAACGFDLDQNLAVLSELVSHPPLSSLRAVRSGRVWAVDANAFFSRPSPRVVDGARLLSHILSGKPVSPHSAVQVLPR